jgi:bacteriocin biosynthesis cyclodehydratase domain-containing protein
MQRPRIKRTIQRALVSSGDLYLLTAGVGRDVQIESPSKDELRLLAAIDGKMTMGDLEAEFGEAEVSECLGQLDELGLIEDAADDDLIDCATRDRFDRQLRYFSDATEGPSPSECQERLKAARAVVLGVGGLGCWVALGLACCGIGELLLVDFDRVELENLNRQVLYEEANIGKPKASVAADRLRAFSSATRIEERIERLDSETAVAHAIDGCDVVIDSCDWPAHEIEHWINSACFNARIPFIAMSHFPPMARVGPLYVPGVTGCYACQEIGLRRDYPLFDEVAAQIRGADSPAGTLGPACELIGGWVSLDLMHLLTGLAEPSTLGASHNYDLRTMEISREAVKPEPGCPVCAEIPRTKHNRNSSRPLIDRRAMEPR